MAVKNEKFYLRAQELRDDSNQLYRIIVCTIQAEIFKNGDYFKNNKLVFENHYASLKIVRDVLHDLGIVYTTIAKSGDQFIIEDPEFI